MLYNYLLGDVAIKIEHVLTFNPYTPSATAAEMCQPSNCACMSTMYTKYIVTTTKLCTRMYNPKLYVVC